MNVKRILGWLLALMLLPLPAGAGSRAESRRKLTVMIYMCGSNLESAYGSITGYQPKSRYIISWSP